jgi:hypothetical protein
MSEMKLTYIDRDLGSDLLHDPAWKDAAVTVIDTYWSGEKAPTGRSFSVCGLWNERELYFRFDAGRAEALIVADEPNVETKTIGLWDRDVCEVFIAADIDRPQKYYEFEAAPTGEWLDVAIDLSSGERISDFDYASGMRVEAAITEGKEMMAMRIPSAALGSTPSVGAVWRGNFFRCVGEGPERGYLAWRPTLTVIPNFHVPERFGEFHFVK